MLPSELAARIDWSLLQLDSASMIDPELRDLESDLIYRADLDGHPAFIYLLFEHLSGEKPLVGLRLLRYMVRLWYRWLDDHPQAARLPPIVPLVVYHDAGRWQQPVAFHDLIALPPELLALGAPHVPGFRYLLDDLAVQSADDLAKRNMSALGRVALILLARARHSPDLLAELGRFAALLREVVQAPTGADAFAAIVSYILQVTEVAPDRLEELARQLGPSAEEGYMTGAQQLTEKVRRETAEQVRRETAEQVRRETTEQVRRDVLCKQLAVRFGALAPDTLERIRGASDEELDRWTERVLSAKTLDDVFSA
jgi:hypothetical protein